MPIIVSFHISQFMIQFMFYFQMLHELAFIYIYIERESLIQYMLLSLTCFQIIMFTCIYIQFIPVSFFSYIFSAFKVLIEYIFALYCLILYVQTLYTDHTQHTFVPYSTITFGESSSVEDQLSVYYFLFNLFQFHYVGVIWGLVLTTHCEQRLLGRCLDFHYGFVQ